MIMNVIVLWSPVLIVPTWALSCPRRLRFESERDIQVAIHDTEEDKPRGYLRTAHARAIGPSNPDFAIYRQMRGDSEC
jgi:hypothetical protein